MTPYITVKLENREEVTISDPMQLFFPDGLGVPAPSSPSDPSGVRFAPFAEDGGTAPFGCALQAPNAPTHGPQHHTDKT